MTGEMTDRPEEEIIAEALELLESPDKHPDYILRLMQLAQEYSDTNWHQDGTAGRKGEHHDIRESHRNPYRMGHSIRQ